MEKSFRDILAALMTEDSASEPMPTPAAPTPIETSFFWQAPSSWARKGAYPAPTARPKRRERHIEVSELSEAGRLGAQVMIRLGATELAAGFSPRQAKSAYRRLAKRLHPDVSPGTAISFMELKKAYEALKSALSELKSDSESAWAAKSPHPDAA